MRLIVMRHAKSSWKTGEEDHARPLNKRGRRDAPRIARELDGLGWGPRVVLSSDAQRTRETWELMAPELSAPPERIEFLPGLYLAGVEQIRAACAGLNGPGPVLVLGHNPGWEDAASWLSGEPVAMTTANAALLEREGDWADAFAAPADWRLVRLLRPKELGDG